MKSLKKALYQRILLLIFLFLVTSISVMFVLNNMTPKYQSSARILIEFKILDITAIDHNSSIPGVIIHNQLEMLKSRTLFSSALNRLGLDPDPNGAVFNQYYSHFSVRQLPFSTMLQLQLTGESPETITNLTNALVESLIEVNNKQRGEDVTESKEYLTKKIEEIKIQKIEIQNAINNWSKSKIKRQSSTKAWNDLKIKVFQYEKEFKDLQNKINIQDWQEAAFIFSNESPIIKDYQKTIRSYNVLLVNELLQPKLNSKKINELQAKIWREKVKAAEYMKIQLDALQLLPNDNWQKVTYAYLRVIDFKMRQEIMENNLVATNTGFTNEEDKTQLIKKLDSLTNSENEIVQKLTDLQVNEGITNIEIRWVDKAIVPNAPYFPTFMQSLILGFLAGLSVTTISVYIIILLGKERDE